MEFVREHQDTILQLAAVFEHREEEQLELAASACEQLYMNLTTETEKKALPIEDLMKVTFTSCIIQVKRIRIAGTRHHDILLEFEPQPPSNGSANTSPASCLELPRLNTHQDPTARRAHCI
ncbi:MAG: hypothetical protein ACQEV7_19720 [Bacillota bacterium]